jgi:hypothetical protein
MNNSVRQLLVWGCDPRRQLEAAWLQSLIGLLPAVAAWDQPLRIKAIDPHVVVLVESGLLTLARPPDSKKLNALHQQRLQRLQQLRDVPRLGVLHLSDEDGLDGDDLYPCLPAHAVVWRNFNYSRHSSVRNFPIGPRAEFLDNTYCPRIPQPSSSRPFPWAFMGTLWASGSRTYATSLFLRSLPNGFFHEGHGFGSGLPIKVYRDHLVKSAFALCPEGDRHLDSFRLYESLQAGCIPVIVDARDMALGLLGDLAPFPVFKDWYDALLWVQNLLNQPHQLDSTQRAIWAWWLRRRESLSIAIRHSFYLPLD